MKRYLKSKRDRRVFWGATINAILAIGFAVTGDYRVTSICGAIAIFNYLLVFLAPDEPEGKASSGYSQMIDNLSNMTASLNDLSAFLERERSRVAETEDTIKELQREKEQLEPVVTTQRETVDAILAAHAARGRASAWKDRIVGFSLGVLSSLVATFIWQAFT